MASVTLMKDKWKRNKGNLYWKGQNIRTLAKQMVQKERITKRGKVHFLFNVYTWIRVHFIVNNFSFKSNYSLIDFPFLDNFPELVTIQI